MKVVAHGTGGYPLYDDGSSYIQLEDSDRLTVIQHDFNYGADNNQWVTTLVISNTAKLPDIRLRQIVHAELGVAYMKKPTGYVSDENNYFKDNMEVKRVGKVTDDSSLATMLRRLDPHQMSTSHPVNTRFQELLFINWDPMTNEYDVINKGTQDERWEGLSDRSWDMINYYDHKRAETADERRLTEQRAELIKQLTAMKKEDANKLLAEWLTK